MNLTAINKEERQFLDDLMSRTGNKTMIDLVNEALTLLDFQLRNLEQGGSLPYADTPTGVRREIATQSFMNVMRRHLKKESNSRG